MSRKRPIPQLPPLVALIAAMLAAVLLAACSAKSRPPVWATGQSPKYPAAEYLLGVGQADSRPAAEQDAYAAVAKIFKAEVSAQSRDWESYFQLERRGQASVERRITLDTITHVSTDKVLENVTILDAWYDKASSQHYVLAGMNRPQAATALLERLAEMDQQVEDALRESRQATDKLIKLRSLKRAIGHLVLREALNADLRIIRASGRGEEARDRVGELTAELDQFLAANLAIGVEITGDQAEVVQNALTEGLLREGLPVTARRRANGEGPAGAQDGHGPELMVRGSVRLWPINVPDPQFKYVRWCSDLVIEEVATRRVVAALARGGREGHLTEREALVKAVRVMQKELTSDLANTLAGYVYGEAEPSGSIPQSACPDGPDPAGRGESATPASSAGRKGHGAMKRASQQVSKTPGQPKRGSVGPRRAAQSGSPGPAARLQPVREEWGRASFSGSRGLPDGSAPGRCDRKEQPHHRPHDRGDRSCASGSVLTPPPES